jgi:hypothetical protein
MMFFLPGDVFPQLCALGWTDGECSVALLPRKCTLAYLFMHPARCDPLYIANHIRKAGRRSQANEQMHMVANAADGLRDSIDIPHHPTEIGVQPSLPGESNGGFAVLGAENNMIVKRQMGRWHGVGVGAPAGALSLLYGFRWLTPPANL